LPLCEPNDKVKQNLAHLIKNYKWVRLKF
jgi:hypothetical protein